ncbi:larval cuticle protein A3A-like [Anoplophora glabripennis]|uniref:larval cuticle protein A3A-like n=1 Tax=Anoplophora glabripennis TaxID=217634 RepID=UPI000C7621E7|nr:larval cuticle protein A3A-like [Anoplophora glabripennis]
MAFKIVVFAVFVAVARAGVIGVAAPAYSAAPAVSYSSISTPHAAPALSYAAPSLSYAAPAFKVAAPVAYAAPVAKAIIAEPSAPANYEFGYAVNDPHTGDSKSQQETRHGDVVQGSYSLIEADGSKRVVHYTVDAHSGFNAVVSREPGAVAVKAVAPVIAKVAAPVAYAAPVAKFAAPVAYGAAPVVKYAAAPAVSYSSISAPLAAAPGYYHH